MNRRAALAGIAFVPLARCTTTPPSAVQQASANVANIASVVGSVVPTLLPTLNLPAATVSNVTLDVHTVQLDAQTITAALGSAPVPTVQEFSAAASAAIGVILPLLGATVPEVAVLTAVLALLPSVLAAFGIAMTTAPAAMPPDAAQIIVARWVATH